MRNIFILSVLFVLLSCTSKNNMPVLFSENCESRGCTGSDYCSACKNCSGCKHCAKEGGSCGVCSVPKKSKKRK